MRFIRAKHFLKVVRCLYSAVALVLVREGEGVVDTAAARPDREVCAMEGYSIIKEGRIAASGGIVKLSLR